MVSFFQTNRILSISWSRSSATRAALPLTFTLARVCSLSQLARNFDQVTAVESSPHSFADLRHNVGANVKCVRCTTEAFFAERAAK